MKSHRIGPLMAATALFAVSCTGASDAPTSTTDPAEALRVRCAEIGSVLIDDLQEYVDGFATYTLEDLTDGEVPGLTEIEAQIDQSRATAEGHGCDMAVFSDDLIASAMTLTGEGPVGRPLAASLRGDPPVDESEAITRTLTPDDDLAEVVATAGPGSHITLTSGTYQVAETLFIDRPITIDGPTAGTATIASSARNAAVIVSSSGSLVLENVTVEHVGEEPGTVIVGASGDIFLDRVVISGGVVDEESGADGHGIALTTAPDDLGNESVVTIISTTISDNAAIGIAVFGVSRPAIEGSTIVDNEACGACFFDQSSGTISESTIARNQIGFGSSGFSRPRIEYNTIEANLDAGGIVEDEANPQIVWNDFENNSPSGIEIGGDSGPTIRSNSISGSERSIIIADEAHPLINSNTFKEDDIAVSLAGTSRPVVESNTFTGSALAAILAAEEATGTIRDNSIEVVDIGIQVGGDASPTITGNSLTSLAGEEGIGVLYVEQASGTLSNNRYSELANGIQVGDSASVEIDSETITDLTSAAVLITGSSSVTLAELTIGGADFGIFVDEEATAEIMMTSIESTESAGIVFTESTSGSVTETTCSGGSTIVLVDGASPDITDTTCSISRQ
jgi:parallel beta-helix repeat protein